MKKLLFGLLLAGLGAFPSSVFPADAVASATAPAAVPFVMQLTRPADGLSHRRAFLQIARVLDEIGEDKLHIEVVAYEDGIVSLLKNNQQTADLLAALNRRGVVFKACRISMRASDLVEDDFPLEVEFVPAGAPEVIRLQMAGFRYWRP